MDRKHNDDPGYSESQARKAEDQGSLFEDEYLFVLVNPKDANSSRKSYLQDIIKIYTKELPAMNYAANTGKQSTFLERCVSNGKYCTLLLKSKSIEGSGQIIAAITYQIVPADTQFAEIPLAAVSSKYQHKGIGHLLYMELRKRLQNVGIHTILCWGDKESEGFWLKQGFLSIAEIDTKGRARRLPIKAGIRKALCFPGGSTLMVSHLNKDFFSNPEDTLEVCFPLKSLKNSSSSSEVKIQGLGFTGESYNNLKMLNQMTTGTEFKGLDFQGEGLVTNGFYNEGNKLGGSALCRDSMHICREGADYIKAIGAELSNIGANVDVNHCSCSTQGAKRRVWEASLSSLKSKKVKGSHLVDCQSNSNFGPISEREDNSCFDGCSLGTSRNRSSEAVTHRESLSRIYTERITEEFSPLNEREKVLVSKDLQSKRECFKIMLMNIADHAKRAHLTKVIEDLGGAVTSDGSVSTHVITGKVRKTLNFCTALCSGAWIVSPSWLKESFREGRFVDELPYILSDEDYVSKNKTDLKDAVLRAKANPRALLKGYNVCIAAHVQPPVRTLSAIVRAAGGNIIRGLDKVTEASKTIFLACEEDMEEALVAAKKGIWTFSSDWLMHFVMRQELDLDAPQFAESL